MIDPYRAKVDTKKLARLLFERHRGRDRRVKMTDLAVAIFSRPAEHGSPANVALRNVLADLIQCGLPIGSESGPEGGVYWMATEGERQAVIAQQRAQVRTMQRRLESLAAASLEYRDPPGQEALFS